MNKTKWRRVGVVAVKHFRNIYFGGAVLRARRIEEPCGCLLARVLPPRFYFYLASTVDNLQTNMAFLPVAIRYKNNPDNVVKLYISKCLGFQTDRSVAVRLRCSSSFIVTGIILFLQVFKYPTLPLFGYPHGLRTHFRKNNYLLRRLSEHKQMPFYKIGI